MLYQVCLFFKAMFLVFSTAQWRLRHTGDRLLELSRVFGNDLYRRTWTCLLCMFVPPPTVQLHYFVNSGSFLWTVHIFSFHVWTFTFMLQAVIAWLESMTRLESRLLVTRTRLESRWKKWWLDSSHVFHRMSRLDSSHSQWLETRVRVIFTKSLSSWWTSPVGLHTKKWGFFDSVMIKIGGKFLFWLSSCAMLHFKDQVSLTWVEADLRLCFHWEVSRDTIYWHLIVVQCSICILWSWQWVSYCDLV